MNCRQRNGPIGNYRVSINDEGFLRVLPRLVSSTMFTVTGLPPCTSYTFEVQAVNTVFFVLGEAATLAVNTQAPQSET